MLLVINLYETFWQGAAAMPIQDWIAIIAIAGLCAIVIAPPAPDDET